ncbi:putative RNA methyltransferase [Candidatus Parabeggiatoa sp. HSG14]|uniref:putative RNA methyltransferase n=1 Tax=Candidatus Parabeggiatoa sp. HSG14 TaxID=3055593 RepID=UPI0025A6DC72|nr:methyltransferase domain-containing protein [Thiotrichales bacterium HSG14]
MSDIDFLIGNNISILSCPVCNTHLQKHQKSYNCTNGHNFDIAKQGYINLLQSNKKRSTAPGDNRNMINARRHFLEQRYYEPVSNLLNEVLSSHISHFTNGVPLQIVEVGSGDGYYINRLRETIHSCHDGNCYGVDISKQAAKIASTKYHNITFVVASAVELPFIKNSVDVLISLFSPFYEESAKQVLAKQGIIIQAVPLTNHLLELRQVLYKEVNINDTPKNILTQTNYFKLEETKILNHSIHLSDHSSIQNIFSMTPHYWKTSPERKRELSLLQQLDVTLEIEFRIYTNEN